MRQHFLIPLDGSRLAETVLPGTLELARRGQARLTLLHILEQSAPTTVHGDRHLRHLTEAEIYLAELANRLEFPRAQISLEVHPYPEVDVAHSIFLHAKELSADLVVLSTHGYVGPREWLFGSVPQKVLRRDALPVFLLQPLPSGAAPKFHPRRAVVYLDPSAGEANLKVAEEWAQRYGMELHLLMCIPTRATLTGARAATGVLLPTTMTASLDWAAQDAADQLRAHRDRLQASGIKATVQITRGDSLVRLVEIARGMAADLLCLTTRGESGLSALGTDEVASKILTRFPGALLLVHPGD